jgi:TonB family protein
LWQLPPRSRPRQRVTLRFVLDAQGVVGDVKVIEASDRDLARSAIQALKEAEPISIPPGAECIAGLKIVGTFSNPVD